VPAEQCLTGIAVSPGVAIGPVFLATEAPTAVHRATIAADQVDAELARFELAVQQSQKQVRKLRTRLAILPQDGQIELSPLLDAYAMMMGPSRLTRGIRARIAERLVDAPTAVVEEVEWQAGAVLALPQADDADGLARRAAEIGEIGLRLVRNLLQTPFRSLAALPAGAVLVCDNLRPADAALLDPSRLAGVAVEDGGAEGHTAIMLRALALPATLGVAGLMAAARAGETVVVDGTAGTVTLRPGETALLAARASAAAFARERQRMQRLRRLPAVTVCGTFVELQANLEIPAELPLVAQSGAAGIGLLRSEFLFINRDTLPDETVQYETYRQIIEAMAPDPVTVRVLDWGGEKESEAMRAAGLMPEPPELNPALGLRGIRLLLKHPALLEVQLAAVLRASVHGQARVLLPMVCRLSEVRAARAVMLRVAQRLRRRGAKLPDKLPPLGIMIETPAAALSADALALEADFFAIGTNDLTMYALAVDRGDSAAATLFDPLHPGVLRLVRFAIEAALRVRKPVSVCGEVAGDPRLTPLLLGLGLRSFSMTAAALPRVKQSVRGATVEDCVRLAHTVMEQPSAQRVRAVVLGS
jgi:phosphotransferase system enzyme I (PtsI)